MCTKNVAKDKNRIKVCQRMDLVEWTETEMYPKIAERANTWVFATNWYTKVT